MHLSLVLETLPASSLSWAGSIYCPTENLGIAVWRSHESKSAFTPLILVSSQSTQKVPRQTAVQVQDFPWVRTKRSPNNLCMQACTVSREKHQCSHDVNGKRYRYESIFERKGSGGGKSCDQSYQYHGMPRQ